MLVFNRFYWSEVNKTITNAKSSCGNLQKMVKTLNSNIRMYKVWKRRMFGLKLAWPFWAEDQLWTRSAVILQTLMKSKVSIKLTEVNMATLILPKIWQRYKYLE